MKLHISLFVLFAASAIILGPFIASTSGSSSIEILSAVVTFGSLILMLIFGLLATKNSSFNKGVKAGLIFLVILATAAAFIAAALQM